VARPNKSLLEHVHDGSYRARRHRGLIGEEPNVPWPAFAALQDDYRAASSEERGKAIEREFEHLVLDAHATAAAEAAEELEQELSKLGPPGSAKRTIALFPRFFRFDDETPFVLEGWQKKYLRMGSKRDRHDRRVFKQIDWWIPRGNGKTPLASGKSIDDALGPGRPKVFQIAGDLSQAKLGLDYATEWINEGELGQIFKTYGRIIRRRDGRGRIEILPAGGTGAHGRVPRRVNVDELWGFETKPQVKTFRAMETAIFKDAESELFIFSTAGYTKQSLAGAMWDSGFKLPKVETFREGFLTIARDEEAGRLFIAYGMPDGYDLDLENDKAVLRAIRLANPGSWIDHRELLRALRRTDEDGVLDWLRFNLNHWTKQKGAWFKHGIWKAIASEFEFGRGDVVFVGVDCSLVHDTTAVAWAKRIENGRIAVDVEVFSPVEGVPAHRFFPDGMVDTREIERFIVELANARGYQVAEIAYDPTFFHDTARRLKERGFRVIEYLPASAPYKQAIQDFYGFVNDGTATHRGDNAVFNAHAEAVAAEKREDYWQLYRLKASERFDAVVAAALAVTRCAFDKRSVYEKEGLLVLEEPKSPANRDDEAEPTRTAQRVSEQRARELGLLDDQADDDDDLDLDEEDDEWND
jgi:phage terminase large subunit-like protein